MMIMIGFFDAGVRGCRVSGDYQEVAVAVAPGGRATAERRP